MVDNKLDNIMIPLRGASKPRNSTQPDTIINLEARLNAISAGIKLVLANINDADNQNLMAGSKHYPSQQIR